MADLAGALQHVTANHLAAHRDVKPANVLVDQEDKVYLTDFGLTLQDESVGRGPPDQEPGSRVLSWAGSRDYMSPEQLRGESHKVDGKADIYSLGVVFYEMLTGHRPFPGARSNDELLDLIETTDVKSPRMCDRHIPAALSYLCLKALARLKDDRYECAQDLANALEDWLQSQRTPAGAAAAPLLAPAPLPDAAEPTGTLGRVVPRGLRAFGPDDKRFFLQLLPDTIEPDGLPKSVSFWKRHAARIDPDDTFAVGLLYGRSGCGKSSLVRAGILPLLDRHVVAVPIEADADTTEARLLKALHKQVPGLDPGADLAASLRALRSGGGLPRGHKVLLVLDQFEQWLHAHQEDDNPGLARALGQCDGGRVQALLLVREDFLPAALHFFKRLNLAVNDGEDKPGLRANTRTVQLFSKEHARKVLTAFGRGYGRLPEDEELGPEQARFLDRAVEELAQGRHVVSVRLALFAQMVQDRPWVPATLDSLGGVGGVGVAFLRESLSPQAGSVAGKMHHKAARAVLQALLPEAGSDIKRNMRPVEELQKAAGCAGQPEKFEEVRQLLDNDLRLITSTDPEGRRDEERTAERPADRYYQLTHDYLVPSVRDWLTEEDRRTYRGRARLRLTERAASWNARSENRQLPAWWEWLDIRFLTRPRDWTGPQRQMMRQARRYHLTRAAVVTVLLGLLTAAGVGLSRQAAEQTRQTRAAGLVDGLLTADLVQVPDLVRGLEEQRPRADPLLRQAHEQAEPGSARRLKAALALLPVNPAHRDEVCEALLEADPAAALVLREVLRDHGEALLERLWSVLEKPEAGREGQRLRAACALAEYDPTSERWKGAAGPVVRQLVAENVLNLPAWLKGFQPVRDHLLEPLAGVYRDAAEGRASERALATELLADYARDRPGTLADLLMDADKRQFARLLPLVQGQAVTVLREELPREPAGGWADKVVDPPEAPGEQALTRARQAEEERERLAKRQANAGVALVKLGQPGPVWPLLAHRADPRVRSYLLQQVGLMRVSASVLLARLRDEKEASARHALLLALGECDPKDLAAEEAKRTAADLDALYRDDPDPGVHGAVAWLLGEWQRAEERAKAGNTLTESARARMLCEWKRPEVLVRADKDLQARDKDVDRLGGLPEQGRQWYVNGQGQTMVLAPEPGEFWMGSPRVEAGREDEAEGTTERRHRRRIPRTFAIAAHEVTVEQFLRMPEFKDYKYYKAYSPTPGHPVNWLTWYEAAHYCNLLSEKEGIPKDQWCYEPKEGKYGPDMTAKADFVNLRGYRLPTEAEWEYACRAGAVTARYYGEGEELLGRYAWYTKNSLDRFMLPAGTLRPNDLGLFDMQGNALEWCHDRFRPSSKGPGQVLNDEDLFKDSETILKDDSWVLRGGSFLNLSRDVRSSLRGRVPRTVTNYTAGFRPARTFP